MKKILTWIILIIILCVLFVYFTKDKNKTIGDNTNNNGTTTQTVPTNNNQNTIDTSNWVSTSTDEFSFKYPESLGTNYVNTVDWPPVINAEDQAYSCTEGGTSANARAGQTSKEIINGKEYCVTRESEGAAGSVYTNYAYAFANGDQTLIATFSLRAPQCMNYDDPKQTECLNEEASFNISPTVDAIAKTIVAK